MHTLIHEGGDLRDERNLALARYRFQVFVKQLGWDLPCRLSGVEQDQYDRADTVYVTARDEDGDICGCARLLPTVRPYLLKDLFPALLGPDRPAPASSDVWELSRFAAGAIATGDTADTAPARMRLEWAVRPLMASVVACAARRGARRLIGVTFVSMERLFRRIGLRSHRVGDEQNIDGKRVVACWIDIDWQTCAALGIDLAKLEFERLRLAVLRCRTWPPASFAPVAQRGAGMHGAKPAARYPWQPGAPLSLAGSSGNRHPAGSSYRPRPAIPAARQSR